MSGIRLLNAKTWEVEWKGGGESIPPYAILSHVWLKGENNREIELRHLHKLKGLQKPSLEAFMDRNEDDEGEKMRASFDKITMLCKHADSRGIKYVWLDTCCIDKTSSSELTRSINSMFQWYEQADECYVYLDDVKQKSMRAGVDGEGPKSKWFTRGWTLQELLAHPWEKRHDYIFYNSEWEVLGNKESLKPQISEHSGISFAHLEDPSQACVATVLSWAAARKTTEEADRAYSLLGLLGVSMEASYGGSNDKMAFRRLQEKLVNDKRDESIFAWTLPTSPAPSAPLAGQRRSYGMMAPSIECFSGCKHLTTTNASQYRPRPYDAYKLVGELLVFKIPRGSTTPLLAPARSLFRPIRNDPLVSFAVNALKPSMHTSQDLTLNCWKAGSSDAVLIKLSRTGRNEEPWRRSNCQRLDWAESVARSATSMGRRDVTEEMIIPS